MNRTESNDNFLWNAGIKDREPAFAGQFYSRSKKDLTAELNELFEGAGKAIPSVDKVRAIISPHAGYVYSGHVAASAFNQISGDSNYKRVFVIASSHRYSFKGASVYTLGNYSTPLGRINVDIELVKHLVKSSKIFLENPEAHIHEHSLEVQLPFLQHKFKNGFSLVPIILGINKPEDAKKIAEVLRPYFTKDNLFVFSTDFSHYPRFEDAIKIDANTANAICSNQPQKLLDVLKKNKGTRINNLSTSLCGWTSVLTLLYLTEKMDISYNRIEYRNSGHAKNFGQKNRVVGYWAISVTQGKDVFKISKAEREKLLDLASNSIKNYLSGKRKEDTITHKLNDVLNKKIGAFVSVYIKGELRGCIGNFGGNKLLSDIIQSSAISACNDLRFKKVGIDELDDMELEISVLSQLRKINSIDEIELGRHGIYIKQGLNKGTFLPQVAKKTGWNLNEFLGHCARDKANIGWDGWKNAEIFIYEAIIFRGKLKE